MSWLSKMFHPEEGYKKAQEQLDKYYQQAQQMQQPYINQGQEAYGGLSDAMKSLLDPQALQDKWASGYKESDAAKNAEAMAQEHGMNALSSMGLMGSSPGLQAIQAGTSKIGMDDRQKYLDDLMQKYLAGAGIGQNIYGVGANAAGQMGQNAMNMGQNSAGMAYGQQNAQGNMMSGLFGGLANLGASALGSKWNIMGGK